MPLNEDHSKHGMAPHMLRTQVRYIFCNKGTDRRASCGGADCGGDGLDVWVDRVKGDVDDQGDGSWELTHVTPTPVM